MVTLEAPCASQAHGVRKAALTVRLPGARIALTSSTWTCGQTRFENSGA